MRVLDKIIFLKNSLRSYIGCKCSRINAFNIIVLKSKINHLSNSLAHYSSSPKWFSQPISQFNILFKNISLRVNTNPSNCFSINFYGKTINWIVGSCNLNKVSSILLCVRIRKEIG